jgi:transposase InsO family protein
LVATGDKNGFTVCEKADDQAGKLVAAIELAPSGSRKPCRTLARFRRRNAGVIEGLLGDELLGRETFTTLEEAKVLIAGWRKEYNHVRPHSARGYKPPAPIAGLLQILAL